MCSKGSPRAGKGVAAVLLQGEATEGTLTNQQLQAHSGSLRLVQGVAQVESFRFKDDQKRALLSRLLQRRCVNVGLGVPWGKVRIKRTKAKKPFVVGVPDRQHAPNFNFNVSHEARISPVQSLQSPHCHITHISCMLCLLSFHPARSATF